MAASSNRTSSTDGARRRGPRLAPAASRGLAAAALLAACFAAGRVDADPVDAAPGAGTAAPTAEAGAAPSPAPVPDQRSPITVEADHLEVVDDDGAHVKATGDVVVEWDTTKLRASEIVVDQRERRVTATGQVRYESDELRAEADHAELDVDDETGVLDRVDLRLVDEPGRFGGKRLEKAAGRRVLLDRGYFTTCETDQGHAPDWELRGKHLDVRLDDYARLRGGRLHVRGVPVLYLPYLVFPTKETRQSGLLPFFLGTSSNRGVVLNLPGYWAIDKHRDLTMTAVAETSARLGIDGLFRYAPSKGRWGELHAAFYNEDIRGKAKPDTPAVGVPNDRGNVELVHRERGEAAGGDWTGYADIQWVGDERFLREVNALSGDAPERDYRRSQRYTTSRAGALFARGFTSAGLDTTLYQDLVGVVYDDGDPDTTDPVKRDVLHRPVNGWLQRDGALGPVAYAVDSSLASFIREKGASGERLDVASHFALPLLAGGPVTSRAWARGRGSVYAMQDRDVLDDEEQFVERLDTFPLRGVIDLGMDTRSKFARDYAFDDSERWSGMYHSLEPFAAMRYTNRSTSDAIPLFNRLDAIDGRDVATYGVDSRFLLRRLAGRADSGSGPFELARVSLSQSYNLSREVVDDHFSDIDLSAFVRPLEGLAVRTLASYNVGATQLRGANASVSWETGPVAGILRGPSSQIAAAYRYVRSDTEDDVLQSTELLARLGLTRNVSLGVKGLYDIVGNKFVEKAVGFTFTSSCDCWSVGLGVIDRVNPSQSYGTGTKGNPGELQVRLAFELKGLGGFGSGVTQGNSPALASVEYEDAGFWRAGW